MNVSSAQMNTNSNTQQGDNYVDAYMPPGSDTTSATSGVSSPAPASTPAPASDTGMPATQASEETTTPNQSETLEDQNIFFLLGVTDGTEAQREAFLDELQQVIWEDFLEYDVKLLITSEEMTQLQTLLDSQTDKDLEKQEKIVVYLEKLIPDLEEIMLEKALELKEEMVRERAVGLHQYYAEKPEKIERVEEAEKLMDAGKWYTAAHMMNSLSST